MEVNDHASQDRLNVKLINERTDEEEFFVNDGVLGMLRNCFKCLSQDEKIVLNSMQQQINESNYKRKNVDKSIYDLFDDKQKYISMTRKEIENEVEDLLNKGSDINYRDKFENTVLLKICKAKNKKTVEIFNILLLKGANKSDVNSYGHSILHNAATVDNVDLIRAILTQFPELKESVTNVENQTALHYAAKKGNEASVRCLIEEFHADKEAKDHQGRTPLYVAAEHGQKIVTKKLIEFGCNEKVINIYGQKALFHIIRFFPDIACDILDNYYVSDKYTRKNNFFLRHVEHEPFDNDRKIPNAKSILALIVEEENLNLLIHPVITRLVQVKWNTFTRMRSYWELLITFINIAVWNLSGILVPYQDRHLYSFPHDWWRIFLYLVGIFATLYFIFIEIKELRSDSAYQERIRQQRLTELELDRRVCYPLDEAEKNYLLHEQKSCKKAQIFYSYIQDIWNWFDIISVILLSSVIFTHLADIATHNELIARANLRIMSVTNIFISLRLLKVGRIINQDFGVLVITITYGIRDLLVWVLAYVSILIPFTTAFYSIFGGKSVNEQGEQVEIYGMQSYSEAIFALFAETFGTDVDVTRMNLLDDIITNILVASYVGLTTLIMVNIFIAILTSTFNRVQDSARAYFILQRAIEIIRVENRKNEEEKREHYYSLQTAYVEKYKPELKNTSADRIKEIKNSIENMKNEVGELCQNLTNIELKMLTFKKVNASKAMQNNKTKCNYGDKLYKIAKDFEELKTIMELLIEENQNEYQSNLAYYSMQPQVDILKLSDVQSTIKQSSHDLSKIDQSN